MKGLLLRWSILTLAILAASYLLDGIEVTGFFPALAAAAVLGILNAFLRPILFLLTLPLVILSLGLFTIIINALLLMLVSAVMSGFNVAGFWAALVGSLVISAVSWLLSSLINNQGRVEVINLKQHRGGQWQ
jgi:putative membrane protein